MPAAGQRRQEIPGQTPGELKPILATSFPRRQIATRPNGEFRFLLGTSRLAHGRASVHGVARLKKTSAEIFFQPRQEPGKQQGPRRREDAVGLVSCSSVPEIFRHTLCYKGLH
jgi:hypothetical protein